MSKTFHAKGEFRSWCFTPSHNHFFLIEYTKRIGIAISGILYGEFYPDIIDPIITILTQEQLSEFAERKSISSYSHENLIQLKSKNKQMSFIASRIQIADVLPPYSADSLLMMTNWGNALE
jgi:hypothetical protein